MKNLPTLILRTDGGHSFMVRCRNLARFVPLLFQGDSWTPRTECSYMKLHVGVAVVSLICLVSGSGCSKRGGSSSIDSDEFYFPAGIFDQTSPDLDRMSREWYSKHLRAMKEPSLSRSSGTADVTYRFLWLRTFHHPICVRIEKDNSSYALYAIELDGAAGHNPGKVAKQVRKELPATDCEALMAVLSAPEFWETWKDPGDSGLDGAEWILEGVQEGHYRLINQWSPQSGEYREVCLQFLKIAGFLPPASEVY